MTAQITFLLTMELLILGVGSFLVSMAAGATDNNFVNGMIVLFFLALFSLLAYGSYESVIHASVTWN